MDMDADGEAEDVSMAAQGYSGPDTALVRRRVGESIHSAANGGNSLNMNGKRALDPEAVGGRSGGTKLYKEHVEGNERD
jgi:hypothetical protein